MVRERSLVGRVFLSRRLWAALLMSGFLGGALIGGVVALAISLPFTIPAALSAKGSEGSSFGIIMIFGFIVGAIIGSTLGGSSAIGSVLLSAAFKRGASTSRDQYLVVIAGAIGGAAIPSFLLIAPLLQWNAPLTTVLGGIPAALGFCWAINTRRKSPLLIAPATTDDP